MAWPRVIDASQCSLVVQQDGSGNADWEKKLDLPKLKQDMERFLAALKLAPATRAPSAPSLTIGPRRTDLSSLQVGRAQPTQLEQLLVKAYGEQQTLKSIATVSSRGPQVKHCLHARHLSAR